MTGPGAALVRPRPVANPALRLVVLHHAGGSHLMFRRWARLLPASWEACLVDAPGRGHAADRPPARLMAELVAAVLAVVRPLTDRPVAVFGHSMGALVGLALTTEMLASGLPAPVWLGVSAHPGPPAHDRPPGDLHRLDRQQLRVALHRIGGIPAVLRHDDDLWDRVEPLVRADLEVVERWRPAATAPLPVPIGAFGGLADPVTPVAAMSRWTRWTRDFLGVRGYPGDHFYFQHAPRPLLADVVGDVQQLLSPPDRPAPPPPRASAVGAAP